MLFCRAALPLSRKTLTFTAGIIRRHRTSIGSRWRKPGPGQQALLVLAYLRETIALLAARAPRLCKAARDARKAGWAYAVLDGALIPIDRVAADRPFYSGKHKVITAIRRGFPSAPDAGRETAR